MSKTYGWMKGRRGKVTRCGHNSIWAKLQTWNGSVTVTVNADETADIDVSNLNVRINGTRMFAKAREPAAPSLREMLKMTRDKVDRLLGSEYKDHVMPKDLVPLIKGLEKLKAQIKDQKIVVGVKELNKKLNDE